MQVCNLPEQEGDPVEDRRGTLQKPFPNFYFYVLYKDVTKRSEEIYKPFGLTRATFYRYAKILDHHTDEEIKKMGIKK